VRQQYTTITNCKMSAVHITQRPDVAIAINPIGSTGSVDDVTQDLHQMKVYVSGTGAPVPVPAAEPIPPPLTYTGCPVCGHS
jgi:hypothetical protein